ncbi:MAG TPA: GlmU family protein [Bacteroidia bacterium]|jgi:UDP-N-acetylglucosamine diphosphorylase/glucosamine-1-phosphate N-acetyltransferase|nr:GlmU family protein [Bacteroidia bacterium]
MINYVLFDDAGRSDLLPLTFTRPACEVRIGILTIKEKWEIRLKAVISYKTENYLAEKFPFSINERNSSVFINGRVCPDDVLVHEIKKLKLSQSLYKGHTLIAYHGKDAEKIQSKSGATIISYPWDIFKNNGKELETDFTLLTKGRRSKPVSKTNKIIGKGKIFLEAGAGVECAVLNTVNGPIYIGKDAVVMEGCLIRGGFALCEHSELKMGAKIYGPTTIGPHSKVGGEVNNSVIFGYSNKGHDGFLGNSVLGEWCNLGADTNNSNLKNNYGEVKVYNYTQQKMIGTGLQFCGLIMGDHSKTGINTMLNTGTVVGVNANIFGGSFPPPHVPSFSWGGSDKLEKYELHKAFEVAQRVMERRNIALTDTDKKILEKIAEQR